MKRLEEKIVKNLMRLATIIILGSLFLILFTIIKRGLPSLNWDMVTKIPSGGFILAKKAGF
jgi:phosphate transport system permease protein